MNLKQLNTIGQGALFPIRLSTPTDKGGNPEYTTIMVNGVPTKVLKVGWYPDEGIELVKNNITSLLIYQIGERFRQEDFGSRLWECIEEPNTQLLHHMVTTFIRDSIQNWESRVRGLDVNSVRDGSKLYIQITFAIEDGSISEAILEYDNSTNIIYGY